MKLGIMELLDVKSMSEEDVKRFTAMDEMLGEAFEKKTQAFLKDEIKMEELNTSIKSAMEAIKSLEDGSKNAINEKTFNEAIKSINESLVRMKAATEVKDGEVVVKSLEQQVYDQLKDFVTVDKKGAKNVDLKGACKAAPGYKKTINLVLDTKASAIMSTGAPHLYHAVDNVLSVNPRSETVIRQYSNVASISARSLTYAQVNFGEGDAAWTPEGGLKPGMEATIEEVTITAGKVALTAKLTEETLSDLPQLVAEIRAEIINRIGIAEEQGILNGTGTGGQIKGVAGDMPAYGLQSFKVSKPSFVDAIVAAYTQITVDSKNNYQPNLVLMHPVDYWTMMREKDANGRPLNENLKNFLPSNMTIVASTAVAQGDLWIGDFNYLNIRDVWQLSITFGWENDDFTKNLVTMIGEKRLMAYIKSQYKSAFVKDKFATIIEAINATA